ncbi:MAG: 4-hydroxy-tetrahydrodipicolinate synthase, partial [Gammaproteobacteria bacterium]
MKTAEGFVLLAIDGAGTYHARFLNERMNRMFSGSLVALVTPMSAQGAVDFESLEKLVEFHVENGSGGLVVAGTTGESSTLEKSEHVDVISAVAKFAHGRIPIIAGTGSNSTAQTVELSKEAGRLPIDAYLVVTPYYNKPTQEGLFQHFTAIADAVEKPIMLYNVPGRTVADLLPDTVARLAEHPQIFGIKEATGNLQRMEEIKELCGTDFKLYSGDDPTGCEFMLQGGAGVVSVTANVVPRQMADMCNAAIAGDRDNAQRIDSA